MRIKDARRIFRWVVPVDSEVHLIGSGPVVHIACRPEQQIGHRRIVEVWTDEVDGGAGWGGRRVSAYGTGEPVPEDAHLLGSALDGTFVWHVAEVQP